MRTFLFAGAAALSFCVATTGAIGQAPPPAASAPAMSATQKADYDGWPAEQRAAYDAMAADYQTYFWTLTPTQQKGWWILSDAQRKQLHDMPPERRAAVWTSIEQQLNAAAGGAAPAAAAGAAPAGEPAAPVEEVQANPRGAGPASATPTNPATADTPVPPAQPADPSYQAGPYKGAMTAPPPEAANKEYPVCSRTVQDSCRNRGGK